MYLVNIVIVVISGTNSIYEVEFVNNDVEMMYNISAKSVIII